MMGFRMIDESQPESQAPQNVRSICAPGPELAQNKPSCVHSHEVTIQLIIFYDIFIMYYKNRKLAPYAYTLCLVFPDWQGCNLSKF